MTTSQSRDSRGGDRGGSGGGRPGTRRFSGRRRRQCVCKEVGTVGYKDVSVLRRFISDRGRIESGRKSGNCAKCQRELSTAIARARFMGLLPYAPNHVRVTGSISPAVSAPVSEDESADEPEAAEATTEAESNESAEAEVTEVTDSETAEAEASDSDEETTDSTDDESTDESEETADSVESSEEEESSSDDSEDTEEDSEEEEKE